MKCGECGHDSAEGARFCAQCGARLGQTCPTCGSPTEATHRFCQNCGTKLSVAAPAEGAATPAPRARDPEGERREVTVLFGDLTGFTKLSSSLDPEETHAILNRYFEIIDGTIRAYGGTIDKHIGDGVMAVFGAPIAHSDDPERALRASLDIHAELRKMDPPLTAHIGIASGTVVASGTGSDAHREYTVIGDTVNLAARLQDRAAPGETLVSRAVHDATSQRFGFSCLGEVTIKGLSQPVRLWRLDGLSADEAGQRDQPFIGRKSEISQMTSLLNACLKNRSGQTVLVRGEPGIGKTRLLRECRSIATEMGFLWLRGLVLDFGAGKGLDAIASVICQMLGVAAIASDHEKSDAVARAVEDGRIEAEQRVYLNDLLALPQPNELRSLYDAMDDEARIAGKQALVTGLARKVVTTSPLIVAIEDIHWADDATLSLLARMADCCTDCPAIMVMTSRIEGDPIDATWRAKAAGAPLTTIDLGPLRPEEALTLASGFFAATEGFVQSCVQRSGGNPLFLEQLLRSAEEATGNEIPGSVQSVILTRMDNLDPVDRQALQAASVLGQRFSLEALRHLIGRAEYGCGALVDHFLVRPEGSGFLFAHALVRDGVYASLLKGPRAALHRKAAEWYAKRDLSLRAEHLDRAGDAGAAQAYLAAAEEEARNFRNKRALELSERSLALADNKLRHSVICFRGALLLALGEVDQSIAAFEDALATADDDLCRARARIGLAEGMRVTDQHARALVALDAAEKTIGDDAPLLLAELHHLRGNLFFPAGRVEECMEQHELALKYARRAGSKEWEARALGGLGDAAYLAGRMRTACDNFRRCVELCRELGLGRIEVANRSMVGWTRMYLNEVSEACEDGLAASQMAQKVGQNRAEMLGRFIAGFMLAEQGQLGAGRDEVAKGLSLAHRLGANNFVVEGLCLLARIDMAEAQPAAAKANIDKALEIIREVGMAFFGPMALAIAARLTSQPAERAALLQKAEQVLNEGCVSHNYFWFYRDGIEVALENRDWSLADRYCDALERYTSAEPLPWSDLFVRRGRALARFGRGERPPQLATELDSIAAALRETGVVGYLPAITAAQAAT